MFLCILGGFSTVAASFLARARGTHEPELSITRVKDLEQFIRECQAFKMDHGHVLGDKYDDELFRFRNRFEELLGNGDGYVPHRPEVLFDDQALTTLTESGGFPLLYDPFPKYHTCKYHRRIAC